MTPETVCTGLAKPLLPFVKEVYSYEYKEEPNYSKLQQLLRCILLDNNIAPCIKFDWSKFEKTDQQSLKFKKLYRKGEENLSLS